MDWLNDFLQRGGPVIYAVLFAAVLLWALIAERLWFFYIDQKTVRNQLIQQWQNRADKHSRLARQIRNGWISRFRAQTQTSQILIGTMIAICPLLGLLGTVTGMIEVFDVPAATGTGNARAMSDGIARATLPTMAGLVVALSGLYFRTRFQRLSERHSQSLADQMPIGGQ